MGKYEEALERAKEWEREHPNGYVIRDMMEHIFPGYNDSEDEKIRQTLIDMVKRETGFTGFPSQGQVLAYLEKQKEQKPIFKKGDRVIWDGEEFNILDVDKDTYNVGGYIVPFSREGELHPISQKPVESEGDGLARDFLLKHIEQSIKVLESVSKEKYIGKKGIVDVASELSNWKNARSFILSLQPHWTSPATSMNLG